MATPSIEPTQEANASLLNNSSIKLFNSEDLFASQSEIVQLNESIDKTPEKKTETSTLFDCIHNDDTEIGESQLMELCSGSFATQNVINFSTTFVHFVFCPAIKNNKKISCRWPNLMKSPPLSKEK